jgi:hypothetical protein
MFSQLAADCELIPQYVLIRDSPGLNPMDRDLVRMKTLEIILKPECWHLMLSIFKSREVYIVGYTEEGIKRYGESRGER